MIALGLWFVLFIIGDSRALENLILIHGARATIKY